MHRRELIHALHELVAARLGLDHGDAAATGRRRAMAARRPIAPDAVQAVVVAVTAVKRPAPSSIGSIGQVDRAEYALIGLLVTRTSSHDDENEVEDVGEHEADDDGDRRRRHRRRSARMRSVHGAQKQAPASGKTGERCEARSGASADRAASHGVHGHGRRQRSQRGGRRAEQGHGENERHERAADTDVSRISNGNRSTADGEAASSSTRAERLPVLLRGGQRSANHRRDKRPTSECRDDPSRLFTLGPSETRPFPLGHGIGYLSISGRRVSGCPSI